MGEAPPIGRRSETGRPQRRVRPPCHGHECLARRRGVRAGEPGGREPRRSLRRSPYAGRIQTVAPARARGGESLPPAALLARRLDPRAAGRQHEGEALGAGRTRRSRPWNDGEHASIGEPVRSGRMVRRHGSPRTARVAGGTDPFRRRGHRQREVRHGRSCPRERHDEEAGEHERGELEGSAHGRAGVRGEPESGSEATHASSAYAGPGAARRPDPADSESPESAKRLEQQSPKYTRIEFTPRSTKRRLAAQSRRRPSPR